MEDKRISSRLTGFCRVTMPAAMAAGILLQLDNPALVAPQSQVLRAWAVLLCVAVTAFLVCRWACLPLRDVYIQGARMRVGGFLGWVEVPLSEVAEVTQSRMAPFQRVWIRFRTPTPFGDSIAFIPAGPQPLLGTHPIVGELRRRAGATP